MLSRCLPLTKHAKHFTNLFPLAQAACTVVRVDVCTRLALLLLRAISLCLIPLVWLQPEPHARQASQTQALLAGNLLLASTILSCSEDPAGKLGQYHAKPCSIIVPYNGSDCVPAEAVAEVVAYLTELYAAGQEHESQLYNVNPKNKLLA